MEQVIYNLIEHKRQTIEDVDRVDNLGINIVNIIDKVNNKID